jgi:hypothetical protein
MFVAAVAQVANGATGFVLSNDTRSVAAERLKIASPKAARVRRSVVFMVPPYLKRLNPKPDEAPQPRHTPALDAVAGARHRRLVSTAELIFERSRGLPAELQEQVLNFVESLHQSQNQLKEDWSGVSLAAALRGMEQEQWPFYTDAELVEDWRRA